MTAKADPGESERDAPGDRRSLVETWTEVVADASGLVRAEARLARVETAANLRAVVRNSVTILVGLVLAMVAVTFLSVAAVVGLAALIGLGWALLSVAAICSGLGILLVLRGLARMESQKLLPDQSIRRMSADLQRLSSRGRDVPATARDTGAGDTGTGDMGFRAQGSRVNHAGPEDSGPVGNGAGKMRGVHETP